MQNYYKYLPVSIEDQSWGISVLNTGFTHVGPDNVYPNIAHPSHHYFDWSNGRILDEYQIIYITRGEGFFESESFGSCKIMEGTIILLFPGEKHRYKPSKKTGWDEYWVGFNGSIINNLYQKSIFEPSRSIIHIGFDDTIINMFIEIISVTSEEKSGYQPQISGAVLHILGRLHASSKQNKYGQDIDEIIDKAKFLFRTNINHNISVEEVTEELKVSYSKFRKIFKEYTGLAPGQYIIQLKIQKAKELLLKRSKSIKEIAYELEFGSNFYFSKLFKEKTGMTPVQFRKQAERKYPE